MKLKDRLEHIGILLAHCSNVREVETTVEKILDSHADCLPASADASIFLKPNLNNDMCALGLYLLAGDGPGNRVLDH